MKSKSATHSRIDTLTFLFVIASITVINVSSYGSENFISITTIVLATFGAFAHILYSLNKPMNISAMIWLILILFIGVLNFLNTGNYLLWECLCLMICSEGVDRDQIIMMICHIFIMTVVIKYLLMNFVFGVNTTVLMADGRIRQTLGFGHPNQAGNLFMWLIMFVAYYIFRGNNRRIKWLYGFIGIIFLYLLVFITQSRTAIAGLSIGLVMLIAYRLCNNLDLIKVISIGVTVLSPIVYFISALNLRIPFFDKVLANASGRDYYNQLFFKIYGAPLLGTKISIFSQSEYSQQYQFLDSGWGLILYGTGIVGLLLILFLLIRQIQVSDDIFMVSIISMISLYMIASGGFYYDVIFAFPVWIGVTNNNLQEHGYNLLHSV